MEVYPLTYLHWILKLCNMTYDLCNSWCWFYNSRSSGTSTKGKCAMVSNEVEQMYRASR
jgi:hypothetical protein